MNANSTSPSGAVAPVISCPRCRTKNRVPAAAKGWPRCGKCSNDLPWLTHATTSDFGPVVEDATRLVLVDAWAPWCGPCHMIAPSLEELSREFAGHLKVVKLNVDENPDIAQRLGVQGIPALFFYRDGAIVDRITGALPITALRAKVEEVLDRRPPPAG